MISEELLGQWEYNLARNATLPDDYRFMLIAEVRRLHRIEEAVRDAFLILCEAHPGATVRENERMARAAGKLRKALEAGSPT